MTYQFRTYQFHGLGSPDGLNLRINNTTQDLCIYKCHTIKRGNVISHSVNLSVIINIKFRIKSNEDPLQPKNFQRL